MLCDRPYCLYIVLFLEMCKTRIFRRQTVLFIQCFVSRNMLQYIIVVRQTVLANTFLCSGKIMGQIMSTSYGSPHILA